MAALVLEIIFTTSGNARFYIDLFLLIMYFPHFSQGSLDGEQNWKRQKKIHGKAVGQMEMQCSRLMKMFWVTRLMKREGAQWHSIG